MSKLVLTMGTFDCFHFGHLEFLQYSERLGNLVVGVNTDEFAATFKEKPIMSLKERIHMLNLLSYNVEVNRSAGAELIYRIQPDIITVGTDWYEKDYLGQIDVTQEWLDQEGIEVSYIPYVQTYPISTTEIKRRIREQD